MVLGSKKRFLKYLLLNSKLDISIMGPYFQQRRKKNQKAQGKKSLRGAGEYVPPRHLVLSLKVVLRERGGENDTNWLAGNEETKLLMRGFQ